MKQKMDLGAGVFRSYANSRLTYPATFKELIDNALDQDANEITISVRNRGKNCDITIEDNGSGCDDLQRMVSPGVHHRTATTSAGMYGIGFTASACWITQNGTAQITTTKGGVKRSACVDYAQILETGDTSFEVTEKHSASPPGMKIHFPKVGKTLYDPQRLGEELAFFYAIRLQEGIKITLATGEATKSLKPNLGPKLRDTVQIKGMCGDKPFEGWFGIIEDGERAKHGMSVFWGHRLMTTTRDCCGDFNTSRVYGVLKLGLEYVPNPMKDGFADEEEWALLMDAVYQQIEPVLQKSASESEDFEWSSMCHDIEADVNEYVKGRRERREESEGTVERADTGRKHRQFTKHQPGELPKKAAAWRIKVHQVDGNALVCRHELSKNVLHIYVDKTSPWFSECDDLSRRRGRVESIVVDQIALAASDDEESKRPMFAALRKLGDMADNPIAVYRTAVMKSAKGFTSAAV